MKKGFYFLILILLASITYAQTIYTVAGGGYEYIKDSISTTQARFYSLSGNVVKDSFGNIFIPDYGNDLIKKIDAATGLVVNIAGTGIPGYNGDSIPAKFAQLWGPSAIALDRYGNIYIADYNNRRIRKIDIASGLIFTIAGTGVHAYNGDSIPAKSAYITDPSGITVDTSGNIYFSELGNDNSRIRKIDAKSGLIYTVAGIGTRGYNGDNIAAVSAQLNLPHGVSSDISGNIYIADRGNQRIRKMNAATGIITTIAGNGTSGYNGDTIVATNAKLNEPQSVSLNSKGELYIADSWNNRIRKVDTLGIIYTIAGTGDNTPNGDGGPAIDAEINTPRGVYVDDCDGVYISEYYSGKIRKISGFKVSVTHTDLLCYNICSGTASAIASGGNSPYTYNWDNNLGSGSAKSNLCAGNYFVKITDALGCWERLATTLSQPDGIVVNITKTKSTCSGTGTVRAYVSGGEPNYIYSWSNGKTGNSVSGMSAGAYSLTVTDKNNCSIVRPVSIDKDTASFVSVPICMVTVDSASQNNVIIWDKTGYNNVDSFIVYREIATNDYKPIARIPFNALSQFKDTVRTMYFPNTGDPNAGTYRYKIQTRDTCDSYGKLSPYHNTIYILQSNGVFYWTQPYTIENTANPVTNYVLMRDDSSNGKWHSVSSVAGTQQTISDPLFSIYKDVASWRVVTQWGVTCTPTLKTSGGYNISVSNIYKKNNSIGISENTLEQLTTIYPNPTTGQLTINCAIPGLQGVDVYNMTGALVYTSNEYLQNNIQLNISGFAEGIYCLHIKTISGIVLKKIFKN